MELSQKIFCLMDDDRYEWLRHWKWSLAVGSSGLKYARRSCVNPLRRTQQFIYLHRVVSGISLNYKLYFRDGNPLNMQRANMKIANLRGEAVKWWGSNGVSSFVGVRWDRYYGLWEACISELPIGYYAGEIEAAEAYNVKAAEMLGERVVLNETVMEVMG
jgi:hypothetical protein